MTPAEPGSYEEYLERVRAQGERDRDRFIGVDSHEGEPVYDARDGSLASGSVAESFTFDADEFMRLFNERFQPAFQEMVRSMEQIALVFRPLLERLAEETPQRPLVGVLNSEKRPRHTYPRPRREWWLR